MDCMNRNRLSELSKYVANTHVSSPSLGCKGIVTDSPGASNGHRSIWLGMSSGT